MATYEISLKFQGPISIQADGFSMYTQSGVTICEFYNETEYTEKSRKGFFFPKIEINKFKRGKKVFCLSIPSTDYIIVKEV